MTAQQPGNGRGTGEQTEQVRRGVAGPQTARTGAQTLLRILDCQRTWRRLTTTQRDLLTGTAYAPTARTREALTQAGCWGPDGITAYGRAVREFGPGRS